LISQYFSSRLARDVALGALFNVIEPVFFEAKSRISSQKAKTSGLGFGA
jgi:hypothetical protein